MHVTTLPLLLAVALLQGQPSERARPKFSPVKGTSIDKSVDFAWKMTSTSYRTTMKQGPGPGTTQSTPPVEASLAGQIRVTDTYADVANERVTQLKRLLREVNYSLHQAAPKDARTPDNSFDRKPSALEGRTVVFDWVAERQAYGCADLDPATSKIDPSVLRQEMDFVFALPSSADNLDEWSIDVNHIGNLLFPGGDLFPVRSTTKRPPAGTSGGNIWFGPAWLNMPTWQLLANPTGTITASLKGPPGSDSPEHVVTIFLTVHVDCRSDVSETMRRAIVDACIPEDRDYEFSQTANLSLNGHGEIVWDLARSRARSVRLSLNAMASDTAKLSLVGKNSQGVRVPTEIYFSTDWGGPVTLEFKADD